MVFLSFFAFCFGLLYFSQKSFSAIDMRHNQMILADLLWIIELDQVLDKDELAHGWNYAIYPDPRCVQIIFASASAGLASEISLLGIPNASITL